MKIVYKNSDYIARNIFSVLTLTISVALPLFLIGPCLFRILAIMLLLHEDRRLKDRSCVITMEDIGEGIRFCYLDCFLRRMLTIRYDDMRVEYSDITKQAIVIASIRGGRYWPKSVLLKLNSFEKDWLISVLNSHGVIQSL